MVRCFRASVGMVAVRVARSLCWTMASESHELTDGEVVRGARRGLLDLLQVAGEGQERVERLGALRGFGVVLGDLVDAEVEGSGVVEAGDEGGLGGHRQLQTHER